MVEKSADSPPSKGHVRINQFRYTADCALLGEEGAVFYQQGQTTLWAKAAAKPLRGTSGCGDALVAALVHAQLTEMSWQDTVRWATAAATATAELDGTVFPDPSHIEQLLPRVSMEMF